MPEVTEDLLAVVDACDAEGVRDAARHAPGGSILEQDGLLLCTGSQRLPISPNAAIRTDSRLPVAAVAERLTTHYRAARRGFMLHLRSHGDEDLGAWAADQNPYVVLDAPAMAVSGPVADGVVPRGTDVRVIDSPAGAADYAEVAAEAYESLTLPAESTAQLFADPGSLLDVNKVSLVAYDDGRAVAVAMVLLTHGVGLVGWVGTRVDARGRGLARVCTALVTNAAFSRGARAVLLVASPMGEPVYRRLGFVPVARPKTIVLPAPQ